MRLVVAVVGRPRNAELAAAIVDYEKRAARYWPLDVHEVREERATGNDHEQVREREGDRLLERVTGRIVSCNPGGRSFTSEAFADWLRAERDAARDISILIGGAYGLSETVLSRSSMKLSLAPWTLPHELARLVLAEQLYRAGSILRGEPYHK
jgi:23S rRNA (pseudouridine1915-N3)-methyltransferase